MSWNFESEKTVLIWRHNAPFVTCDSRSLVWYKSKRWSRDFLDDFKSNSWGISRNIKEKYITLLGHRIKKIKQQGLNPVLIFPPRKANGEQSMDFINNHLYQNVGKIFIKSPNYQKLHFSSGAIERKAIINDASQHWEFEKVNITPNLRPHYIYVDDILTTGTTVNAVINFIGKYDLPRIERDEFNHYFNFEGVYMARTFYQKNYEDGYTNIVDEYSSSIINGEDFWADL